MPLLPLSLALPVLLLQATPPASTAQARVLPLEEAVDVGLRHQPSVLQAQASTRAAAGRADQARSGYFPQVSATAQYQRAHRGTPAIPVTTGPTGGGGATTTGPTATGTYDFFNFGANASQLLWDFGQTSERTHAADKLTDSFRISERSIQFQVILNVRRAYFTARAQKALIRVAEQTMANLERHLSQIQGFVTVGTRPEIDLAQARSDLATERVALINAQNGYLIAKAQLLIAMGTPGGSEFDVSEEDLPPIDVEEQPIDQLYKTAITARPELASLERQRDAQESTIRSLKGGYGPTLSAVGGASESGLAIDQLYPSWNVGATLAWPIFQGGLTTGQVREAEGNLDVTRAQLDAQRLQVRLDVEQAQLSLRAAKSEVAATNDALVNTKVRLHLAEGRYEAGVGTIIELGDAQIAVATAAAQVVQAEFNLSTARAQLLTAMGRR